MAPSNRNEKACKDSYAASDSGYSLLPSETLPGTYGLATSATQMHEARIENPGNGSLGLKVIGCIIYTDDIGKKVLHHTPFSYVLENKARRLGVTINTPWIPDDHLSLTQLTIDPGAAN